MTVIVRDVRAKIASIILNKVYMHMGRVVRGEEKSIPQEVVDEFQKLGHVPVNLENLYRQVKRFLGIAEV